MWVFVPSTGILYFYNEKRHYENEARYVFVPSTGILYFYSHDSNCHKLDLRKVFVPSTGILYFYYGVSFMTKNIKVFVPSTGILYFYIILTLQSW